MQQLTILILGTFDPADLLHRKTSEAMGHAARRLGCVANTRWMGPGDMALYPGLVSEASAVILAPPAQDTSQLLPEVCTQGLSEIRVRKLPFLATGCSHALVFVEVARHVLDLPDAGGECFAESTSTPVIHAIPQHGSSEPETTLIRPLRLRLEEQQIVKDLHGPVDLIEEQTNVTYGLNPDYAQDLQQAGLVPLAREENGGRPYLHGLLDQPFHLTAAYLPQLASTQDEPHPLFLGLLAAALTNDS